MAEVIHGYVVRTSHAECVSVAAQLATESVAWRCYQWLTCWFLVECTAECAQRLRASGLDVTRMMWRS